MVPAAKGTITATEASSKVRSIGAEIRRFSCGGPLLSGIFSRFTRRQTMQSDRPSADRDVYMDRSPSTPSRALARLVGPVADSMTHFMSVLRACWQPCGRASRLANTSVTALPE